MKLTWFVGTTTEGVVVAKSQNYQDVVSAIPETLVETGRRNGTIARSDGYEVGSVTSLTYNAVSVGDIIEADGRITRR